MYSLFTATTLGIELFSNAAFCHIRCIQFVPYDVCACVKNKVGNKLLRQVNWRDF